MSENNFICILSAAAAKRIKTEYNEINLLLKSVPATVAVFFVVSVVCMNLLANKTLLQESWIALDGGVLLSWVSFLCMDVVTLHFGPKASTRMAVFAAAVNLPVAFIFYIASIIPSAADDYTMLDRIFGSNWFVLLGSTTAFLLSAGVNNFTNWGAGKLFRDRSDRRIIAFRVGISTFIGQFADNYIFSVIVFAGFAPIFWDGFHWSVLQCAMCALSGAVLEAVMEIFFWPIGHRIIENWKQGSVGAEYLRSINRRGK